MRFSSMMMAMALATAAGACGGSTGNSSGYGPTTPVATTPSPVSTNQVSIAASSFAPGIISVVAGTTVTWIWNDCAGGASGGYGACLSHNVAFDDGSNIVSATQDNGSFSRTFNSAGTFKYHCTIHGAAAMNGQVVVR